MRFYGSEPPFLSGMRRNSDRRNVSPLEAHHYRGRKYLRDDVRQILQQVSWSRADSLPVRGMLPIWRVLDARPRSSHGRTTSSRNPGDTEGNPLIRRRQISRRHLMPIEVTLQDNGTGVPEPVQPLV